MATRTETDITLYTSEELQEIQNNSHSGSATDAKGNIQSVLTAISNATKKAAEDNRDYVDILWSNLKTGSYTQKILGWIDMKATNSEEEHKYGIKDTIWDVDIGSRITESGCSWIFIYEIDAESPFGIRISWWEEPKENSDEIDPLITAWENHPYFIRPENKYIFPTAAEVNTVVVQPDTIQTNKDYVNTIFTNLNYHIQVAAKEGQKNVRIPWTSMGDPAISQRMFVELDELQDNLGESFNYGELQNGHYASAANRVFTIDDFDPLEMAFFNDATFTEQTYTHTDPASTSFTLYDILTKTLGYGVAYAASVNLKDGTSYCIGLTLTWDEENSVNTNIAYAQAYANVLYQEDLAIYRQSLMASVTWTDGYVPTLDDYKDANRANNTMWVKTIVDLISSRMKTAFTKGDRAIHILWSDISSVCPDEVKRLWNVGSCEYQGSIDAAVPAGSTLLEYATASLSGAARQILDMHYFTADPSDPPTYAYGYIRYKKDGDSTNAGGGGNTVSNDIHDISHSESIGLAISLYGYVAGSPYSGSTASEQTADAIRGIQNDWKAKDDPSKKKEK